VSGVRYKKGIRFKEQAGFRCSAGGGSAFRIDIGTLKKDVVICWVKMSGFSPFCLEAISKPKNSGGVVIKHNI
jgi:hypothetical protein